MSTTLHIAAGCDVAKPIRVTNRNEDLRDAHLILVAGVAGVVVIVVTVGRILSRDEAGRDAHWAKVFPMVSVEQDENRRAHASASMLVTDDGVVVRRRTSSRFAAAAYATVAEVPWSGIEQIEYSPGRIGWRYPVIGGSDITIAAAGAVGTTFLDTRQGLGASVN